MLWFRRIAGPDTPLFQGDCVKRCLLVLVLLTLASACCASDWPRWRGPEGNGRVPSGVPVPQVLPADPVVVWHIPVGAGCASPVVSNGKVFYQDNVDKKETLHAAEVATGKELWRATIDDVFVDFQSAPGPRCTPVVDGDLVFAQSSKGEFQCLRVADGKLVWRVSFVKDLGAVFIGEEDDASGASRHGNTGSAMVDGNDILVAVGGRTGASVVCFEKRTGKIVWKSQNDIAGHSGPIVAKIGGVKQVVSFTAEGLLGLDRATGALLWRGPIKTRLSRHVTTPVVVGDVAVAGSYTSGLMGYRVTRDSAGFHAERAWTSNECTVNYSSPVAIGSYLYCIGPMSSLFCLDARTGQRAWGELRFFNDMVHSEYAAFLVMKDNLLILTDNGQLLLVAVTPKEAKTISKVTVCGKNWCNPAYADGRLYLRDEKELKCIELLARGAAK